MVKASSEKYVNLNADWGNLDQKNVIMGCSAVKHMLQSIPIQQSTWLSPNDRVYKAAVHTWHFCTLHKYYD